MSNISEKVYCAFCKLQRRFYNKKHIGLTNVLLTVFASFVTMYVFWQAFDPKVLVIMVIYLMLAEIFVQIRWRLSVVCPHCGFDPVIYNKSPERACLKVQDKLIEQKESGKYLLTVNDPFQNLPKIEKEQKPPGMLIDKSL